MSKKFVVSRRILFGDCDPGGIVYTPRISHFVVEAGLEFFRDRLGDGAERKLFEQGIAPPARSLSIDFLGPLTWDDQLRIEVEVKEIRTHAVVLSFSGSVSGRTVFTSEITQVIVSKETMRPVPVPEHLRSALLGGGNGA